jgi:tetratricopeptide (TPR) repeat protein
MFAPRRWLLVSLVLIFTFVAAQAQAENEGQADLDLAIATKLRANNITDLSEAIRLCESALKKGLDEDNTEFGNQLLSSTRIQRGSRIAEDVLNTLPPSPNWRQFRQVALDDLEKGIEIDAEQPSALFLIARLNMLPEGNIQRAREALDKAIELSQDDPRLLARCLLVRSGLGKKPEEKLADLDAAVAADPKNAAIVRLRGTVHAGLKDFEKALADLKTAVKLQPDNAPTHLALAIVLIEMQKYDEALARLDTVRALQPTSAVPLVQKARVHVLQSDFNAALETLDAAHALDAGKIAVLLLRASVYQELEDNEKALADIDRVLQLRPGDPMAMRFRAILLAGSGKLDVAIDQLEELKQVSPGDIEVMLQLAMFYAAEDKPHEAIGHYSAALEQDPDNLLAIRGRGDSYLSVGKHAEAIADLSRALEASPEDPGILNNLAWVLATSPDDKLRDGKRAKELATKACELTKYEAAHILSTLAAAYAETGDFKTAIKWSTKAVQLGSEEQQEPLAKELKAYKESKPVRERMIVPEPKKEETPQAEKPETPKSEAPAEEKPAEPKTHPPKTDEPKELEKGGPELPPLPSGASDK